MTVLLAIRKRIVHGSIVAAGLAVVGCSSSQPSPAKPRPVGTPGAPATHEPQTEAEAREASLNAALGKLREEHFQASVVKARDQSQGCYQTLLQEDPKIEVRVVLRLRFDTAGKISDMKFESPPADPAFAKCVKEAWNGVSLPVEEDGDLVVPLRFIPEELCYAGAETPENKQESLGHGQDANDGQ